MNLMAAVLGLLLQVGLPFPGPGGVVVASNPFPTIANIQLRLEADCITSGPCANPSNGTTITTWADQSGNGNTATVAAGTCTLNTNQINTNPGVTFSSCHMNLASAIPWNAGGAGITEFVVLKLTSTSGTSELVSGNTSSFAYAFNETSAEQSADGDNNFALGHGTASPTTTYHQMNVAYDNSTNPAFRIDRATDTTVSGAHGSIGGSTSGIGWNKPGNASSFQGQLAFLAIYDRKLSGSEITQVETYLNAKYGL